MQAMVASMMGPEDVAMVFSYSGATKDTIHVAELAKQAGAKIICLTRFVKSPLTSFSDITLLSGANEGPLQGGSTSAEISQLFLIDLMYTEYYRRYYDECSKNNKKTSGSVIEKCVNKKVSKRKLKRNFFHILLTKENSYSIMALVSLIRH